jgi:hypothetical protein
MGAADMLGLWPDLPLLLLLLLLAAAVKVLLLAQVEYPAGPSSLGRRAT